MGWKTKTDGSGEHYHSEDKEYPYGAKRRGSGRDLPVQHRSVDSMKAPRGSGGWKTMRSFRTRDEAVLHKRDLESTPRRAAQSFRIVKGSDLTYPWEVQYRKKENTSARDQLVSKGIIR